MYPIESSDELTNEQVKAALTSLISNDQQPRTVGSRKRGRNKSLDRSMENSKKKTKHIYNEILLSNTPQAHTMVLATSALNSQQMVSPILFYSIIFFIDLNEF
jgi:hypothetical protein